MVMRWLADWWKLTGASNWPSVWSNVLMGFTVGWAGTEVGRDAALRQRLLGGVWDELVFLLNQGFVLLIAGTLIYAGGMVMNHVSDRGVDAAERPGRPIPSGRVSWRKAGMAAGLLLLVGWMALQAYRPPAAVLGVGLVACVVAYNLLHTRWRGSVVLIAGCRGLLVLTAAGAWWAQIPDASLRSASASGVVALWTVGIAVVARAEMLPGQAWRGPVVRGMLAGMPLVDAALVWGLTGRWPVALVCVGLAGLGAALQRVGGGGT
jgi:4-hydroxybenzoate polyprenyltransferase